MKLALCLVGLPLSLSAIAQESAQMSDDGVRDALPIIYPATLGAMRVCK